LFTPALTCGALAGITRGQVISKAGKMGVAVREVAVGRETLDGAEALLVSNSLIGLRPVASLDGRRFPGHALAAALADGVAD
ncbi:MAG TPA: aminotransferase class IV, partial [Phenylobacterium sp.]|nr:aminotransferase class IV [Phenylobacterium sp.]